MRHTLDADKAGSGESLELESLIDALVAHHRDAISDAAAAQEAGRPLTLAMKAELAEIRGALWDEGERKRLDQLGEWLEQDLVRLTPILEARAHRRVPSWALHHPESRLCHAGRPLLVNAIGRDLEVPGADLADDPASDLAALLVGLEGRETPELTRLALDRYLRRSGDYELARLLSLFGTCHALTSARRALRRRLADGVDSENSALLAESMAECRRYLALAERIAEFRFPPLVIAVGVSGSGKSRFTRGLVTGLGAIRVSSEAERQRLAQPEEGSGHPQGDPGQTAVDIFGEAATAATYRRLAACAGFLLDAGIPACVDATCLTRAQRDQLRQQAEARGLPCLLVSFEADDATLRRRIEKRATRQGGAVEESLAVLARQQRRFEPFGDEERLHLVHLDTTADNAADTLLGLIEEHVKLA
ncbi:AAA family ATPase [Halomonas sp. KAO]|uniref:AAA family ATPase n=1 Tax=unclassified Halomonas TaxID=2609666 RepID=UPI00189FCC9A|nr:MULTISPECIES: bifunctional aminoglycoside phosphotransferase/ATP-binding protein [unclassified Halomonas]MBF7053665.1 AAA family ATPase [Halomonas sp. KAO]MDT0500944.1 AAA family ATPase [Halomonas sp. PAR7]MDT0512680.1 AAA family ATPase [Halomonas sp. LES1]MDT0592002.1 AAA family ATPase [Halomonas sp. PAR8]